MVDRETKEELTKLARKAPQERVFVEWREEEREEAEQEEEEDDKKKKDDDEDEDLYIPDGLEDVVVPELQLLTEEDLVVMISKILTVSERNPNEGTILFLFPIF